MKGILQTLWKSTVSARPCRQAAKSLLADFNFVEIEMNCGDPARAILTRLPFGRYLDKR